MAKEKLPPASDWQNRNIENWTVGTFRAYLKDRHVELFGVPYMPFVSWQVDSGKVKAEIEKYGGEAVKRFIDLSFASYRPTAKYPGINFGFMQAYRGNELQRAIIETKGAAHDEKRTSEKLRALDADDLDWI